jgi:predicted  nucleic acid-binding Zn-ribbon protein
VGIKEEHQTIALSVFPNPASNQLTVITSKNNGSVKAELVDIQGKIVFSKDLNNNSNMANQHILDVSSLAKGIYILNLSNLEGKQSLKISIQ